MQNLDGQTHSEKNLNTERCDDVNCSKIKCMVRQSPVPQWWMFGRFYKTQRTFHYSKVDVLFANRSCRWMRFSTIVSNKEKWRLQQESPPTSPRLTTANYEWGMTFGTFCHRCRLIRFAQVNDDDKEYGLIESDTCCPHILIKHSLWSIYFRWVGGGGGGAPCRALGCRRWLDYISKLCVGKVSAGEFMPLPFGFMKLKIRWRSLRLRA